MGLAAAALVGGVTGAGWPAILYTMYSSSQVMPRFPPRGCASLLPCYERHLLKEALCVGDGGVAGKCSWALLDGDDLVEWVNCGRCRCLGVAGWVPLGGGRARRSGARTNRAAFGGPNCLECGWVGWCGGSVFGAGIVCR